MPDKKYENVTFEFLKSSVGTNNLILVVTATDLETEILHNHLGPIARQPSILKVTQGSLTFYCGKLGLYNIVHVQSSMGSLSPSSSMMTVSEALSILDTKVVIMIGIAFGVNKRKQQIGDVLISESVIPYNTKRIGTDETISRAIEAPASKILLNRFRSIFTTWSHTLNKDKKATVIPTRLLSGEELIDNLLHRNQLISEYPDSKGGEMEGAGVYASCHGRADWIIVKAICDFADGNKGKQKKIRQRIAMESSVSAFKEVLMLPEAFQEFGISPIISNDFSNPTEGRNLDKVLFELYDETKEPYYIHRESDKKINIILRQSGVWISGPSGSGKSNLIIRNLKRENKRFVQINLAACNSNKMIEFFEEIYYSLQEYLNQTPTNFPRTFAAALKKLLNLISKHFTDEDLILMIEEIPIGHDAAYAEFASKIFSFVISKSLTPGLEKIKIVLSSINSPTNHIQPYQQKIYSQIKFLNIDYWEDSDLHKLIYIIESEAKFSLPPKVKEELIIKSGGSPRFVKKFFRNAFATEAVSISELMLQIKETSGELNLY